MFIICYYNLKKMCMNFSLFIKRIFIKFFYPKKTTVHEEFNDKLLEDPETIGIELKKININYFNREEFDKIKKDLIILANIKIGDKMCIHNNELIVDNSYFQSVSRWVNGYSSTQIINYIVELIEIIGKYTDNEELKSLIIEAKYGLNNLRETYKIKHNIYNELTNIIDRF